jgi:Skp family chaperone for outer membrane proteins
MRMRLFLVWVFLGFCTVVQAQNIRQTDLVVIDTEELFRATRIGQRMTADLEDRARVLRDENERITRALTEEEQSLSQRRPAMDPATFRAQAAEFDSRVQGIRRTRDAAIANFEAERDTAPRQFLDQVRSVLGDMMLERGAVAILDQRVVFLSLSTADITSDAVARIDATFGDGTAPAEQ